LFSNARDTARYEKTKVGDPTDYKLNKERLATLLAMLKYGSPLLPSSDGDDEADPNYVSERDSWEDEAKKHPTSPGSAFAYWEKEVPAMIKTLVEDTFWKRFDVWEGKSKEELMPCDQWGASDVFDRFRKRINLMKALATLRYASPIDPGCTLARSIL
jgi:hypothetical protein